MEATPQIGLNWFCLNFVWLLVTICMWSYCSPFHFNKFYRWNGYAIGTLCECNSFDTAKWILFKFTGIVSHHMELIILHHHFHSTYFTGVMWLLYYNLFCGGVDIWLPNCLLSLKYILNLGILNICLKHTNPPIQKRFIKYRFYYIIQIVEDVISSVIVRFIFIHEEENRMKKDSHEKSYVKKINTLCKYCDW